MTGTALETGVYRPAFERHARETAGEPRWLEALRREAFARFEERGFPTTRLEEWKYTSVASLARTAFRRAGEASLDAEQLARFDLGAPSVRPVVFVNGRHAPELSHTPAEGARVTSLRERIASDPAGLEGRLGRLAAKEASVFASLNTAFFEDGAVVEIAPGAVVAEPIHLLFFSTRDGGEPTLSHPRVLVLAGRGSEATLVETYAGPEGEAYFTNAVAEVVVDEDASLERCKLQRESTAAFHVGAVAVRQERMSRFADRSVSLGAALSRNDIDQVFAAEGGECTLDGLFLASGTQHTDTHTRIVHAKPRCASRELYKGILDGRSRGVFHGTVLVEQDAQKTDAQQTNKNLLLSREALVNSTPALRILADDVKCKHGSTTGQLDPSALFYLRSRGIGEEAARSLLTYAFASDVVSRIKAGPVRARLETLLRERLPGAPEEAVA
jgi:Fe-S cluster assembly protein SufD